MLVTIAFSYVDSSTEGSTVATVGDWGGFL